MQNLSPKEWLEQDYELIIDVRSPSEYTHSHIISSQNYPVLNDAQHEEVGTLYRQNKFKAKKLGAKYACENIAKMLDKLNITPYSNIGIYCARGGQRSYSISAVLDAIGFKIFRLNGGYKEYRNLLLSYFDIDFKAFGLNFINLYGNTGVGKTRILKMLNESVDLEGFAKHYGSVFGVLAGTQPNQKMFDDLLFHRLIELKKTQKWVFIEAESIKIGKILLGKSFYEHMQKGICVWCECDMDLRVQRCVEDYQNMDYSVFLGCLLKLKQYLSNAICEKLQNNFLQKKFYDVAKYLLENYYDKVYKKPQKIDFVVNLNDLKKAKKDLIEIYQNQNN